MADIYPVLASNIFNFVTNRSSRNGLLPLAQALLRIITYFLVTRQVVIALGLEALGLWFLTTSLIAFVRMRDLGLAHVPARMVAASLAVLEADRARSKGLVEPMQSHINPGTGRDLTILELARTIARKVGFGGNIARDRSRPGAAMRKRLYVPRMRALLYYPAIDRAQGIAKTWDWYQRHCRDLRYGKVAG